MKSKAVGIRCALNAKQVNIEDVMPSFHLLVHFFVYTIPVDAVGLFH